jgi:hypothetical protein
MAASRSFTKPILRPFLSHLLATGLALACGVGVAACSGDPPPQTPSHLKLPPKVEPVEQGPKDAIARATVDRAIKDGLARFLGNLDLEVVLVKGKFVGWRVVELGGPKGAWDGVDLRVGDVVTSVNGFPIEREYQADKAFKSLAVASEIRVSLIRDGKPAELRLAIIDEDGPASAASSSVVGSAKP